MTKNSKKGFTLVELVIVIAILAILAAIAIPVVNSIINTASRNGALSNAETIELAVKECQADIAAKNGEVYAKAATDEHDELTIVDVATAKAIQEAFKTVTYNGEDYAPYWDKTNDKCLFLDVKTGKKAIDGSAAPSTVVPLASDGKPITTGTAIDGL